jgi:hypothetical protein
MLPPDGAEFKESRHAQAEAKKVLSQIHGYLDFSEARFGYIINDEELIFFRRRGTGWGHIDVSPAIRHDVDGDEEGNILNSKMVLFYFHLLVANDEEQWRLKSCFPMISEQLTLGGQTPITRERARVLLEASYAPTAGANRLKAYGKKSRHAKSTKKGGVSAG